MTRAHWKSCGTSFWPLLAEFGLHRECWEFSMLPKFLKGMQFALSHTAMVQQKTCTPLWAGLKILWRQKLSLSASSQVNPLQKLHRIPQKKTYCVNFLHHSPPTHVLFSYIDIDLSISISYIYIHKKNNIHKNNNNNKKNNNYRYL